MRERWLKQDDTNVLGANKRHDGNTHESGNCNVAIANRPELEHVVGRGEVVKLPKYLFEQAKYFVGSVFRAPFRKPWSTYTV